MLKPGVTLAMIVRNDADRLRRCLQSAQPLANRMVVVDTGSTDGSQQVALDFKAELIEIPWPDAFDVARNVAFDRVKTDWTLWLDSDEWFEPGEAEKLKAVLKGSDFFGAFVTRIDLNKDGVDDGGCIDLMRIWRTHPKMRVVGSIHESFPISVLDQVGAGKPLYFSGIRLMHDGYVGDESLIKMQRNAKLLKLEHARFPDSFPVAVKFAEALLFLDEPGAYELVANLADSVATQSPGTSSYPHGVLALSNALLHTPDSEIGSDRVLVWLQAIAARFSSSPGTLWAYARTCFRRNDLEQAQAALIRLVHMRETGEFNRLSGLNPQIFGPALDENLLEVKRLLCEKK